MTLFISLTFLLFMAIVCGLMGKPSGVGFFVLVMLFLVLGYLACMLDHPEKFKQSEATQSEAEITK